jgi:hypothetical protein
VTTKKKKPLPKSKKLVAEDPPIKSQPTYDVKFTKTELVHLRDMFGIYLPPDGSLTVSQALAKQEGRVVSEKYLFDKIVELCMKAKIPVGEEAPDHIIGLSENPSLGVFLMLGNDSEEDVADVVQTSELFGSFSDGDD